MDLVIINLTAMNFRRIISVYDPEFFEPIYVTVSETTTVSIFTTLPTNMISAFLKELEMESSGMQVHANPFDGIDKRRIAYSNSDFIKISVNGFRLGNMVDF